MLFIDTVFIAAGMPFPTVLRQWKPGKSLKMAADPLSVRHRTIATLTWRGLPVSRKCPGLSSY
ncbi:hypothetical protein BN2475_280100 [Paraburkholderia ribeironis]|uniref:Uncharacterized protein n=1 Tax=Paraburkholderia ribeironis TaxID=1247936 RepID=A0A1N7S1K2_9BURK|nr:hypothetical protein BN2475_280100 [Paraburkholderia ribeironis]